MLAIKKYEILLFHHRGSRISAVKSGQMYISTSTHKAWSEGMIRWLLSLLLTIKRNKGGKGTHLCALRRKPSFPSCQAQKWKIIINDDMKTFPHDFNVTDRALFEGDGWPDGARRRLRAPVRPVGSSNTNERISWVREKHPLFRWNSSYSVFWIQQQGVLAFRI